MTNNIHSVLLQAGSSVTEAVSGSQKFDVVIAVIAVIFAGIAGYMISVDIKLRKMENKQK